MFRFNNPDALLVLLLTVAAYCLMRAAMAASWRWLVAVGIVMGTAFLTKMLQGFLVLPGFGLAYLFDLYSDRIRVFEENPPPADWNGVFVLETK